MPFDSYQCAFVTIAISVSAIAVIFPLYDISVSLAEQWIPCWNACFRCRSCFTTLRYEIAPALLAILRNCLTSRLLSICIKCPLPTQCITYMLTTYIANEYYERSVRRQATSTTEQRTASKPKKSIKNSVTSSAYGLQSLMLKRCHSVRIHVPRDSWSPWLGSPQPRS